MKKPIKKKKTEKALEDWFKQSEYVKRAMYALKIDDGDKLRNFWKDFDLMKDLIS